MTGDKSPNHDEFVLSSAEELEALNTFLDFRKRAGFTGAAPAWDLEAHKFLDEQTQAMWVAWLDSPLGIAEPLPETLLALDVSEDVSEDAIETVVPEAKPVVTKARPVVKKARRTAAKADSGSASGAAEGTFASKVKGCFAILAPFFVIALLVSKRLRPSNAYGASELREAIAIANEVGEGELAVGAAYLGVSDNGYYSLVRFGSDKRVYVGTIGTDSPTLAGVRQVNKGLEGSSLYRGEYTLTDGRLRAVLKINERYLEEGQKSPTLQWAGRLKGKSIELLERKEGEKGPLSKLRLNRYGLRGD